MQVLMLPVKVLVHPGLTAPQCHIFTGLELEFDKGFGEKLIGQEDLSL